MIADEIRALAEKFFQQTEPCPATGCWLWTAGLLGKGYGSFRLHGRTERAHRVAYMMCKGPIPKGFCVCHTCDVPSCVNPGHLFLGTKADNNRDMFAKRRNRNPRGEQHGRARLTEAQVLEIRASSETQEVLAKRYGVGHATISRAKRREDWRHVVDIKEQADADR